jgi:hypothetical protein
MMTNKKIVYVKNINADSGKLLSVLSKFNKTIGMNKDTFSIKDIDVEDYAYLLALKEELKSEGKTIIITYE